MSTIRNVKQLSIFAENRPGVRARISSDLAEAGVNLLAISVSDTVDHAVVRTSCDKPERALDIMARSGTRGVETEIIGVLLPNRPGVLAGVAEKLSRAGVNIEYAYGSTPSEKAGRAFVYFRVSDTKKAERALRKK